jgi:hypothetical protein
MKVDEAKTLYKGEWLAFRFEDTDSAEGTVVLHHKDRREFDKELLKQEVGNLYITFSGPAMPEDYSFMF